MKKSVIKKVVALFVALVIMTLPLSCGFAEDKSVQTCPYIFVHGFMAKDIYAEKGNRNSEVIWPPSSDSILELVKEILPDLATFLVDKNYEKLGNAIIGPCKELLGKANLDADGNPGETGICFTWPSASSITKTSQVDFNYDWRLDPVEIAAELNDYINYVLKCSGSDQVVLECHSFGGVITETYCSIYGSSKIKSVCYNTTAIFGETYTGEMMSGNIVFDADSLVGYLKSILSGNEYEDLLDDIIDILHSAGLTDDVAKFGNNLVEYCGEEVIDEVLLPMFAGWLSIWAMVPDEYIADCEDYVFNTIYGDGGESHKGLVEKIDNYNKTVRPFKTKTLTEQNETTNVYVISRYGFTSVPLTPSWDSMSDTVVDTKYSSFGAFCAKYNARFSDAFIVNNAGKKYINPDFTIDASGCLFPDQTWFVRDLLHSPFPDSMDDLSRKLLFYDGQATIDTFSDLPQFLWYNSEDESITADKGTTEEEQTFMDVILNIYCKFVAFKRFLFDLIF